MHGTEWAWKYETSQFVGHRIILSVWESKLSRLGGGGAQGSTGSMRVEAGMQRSVAPNWEEELALVGDGWGPILWPTSKGHLAHILGGPQTSQQTESHGPACLFLAVSRGCWSATWQQTTAVQALNKPSGEPKPSALFWRDSIGLKETSATGRQQNHIWRVWARLDWAATHWLCDGCQVTAPLWAPISSTIGWG